MTDSQATRVQQTVGGGNRYGAHAECRRQLADCRELLVGVDSPGVVLDGMGDLCCRAAGDAI